MLAMLSVIHQRFLLDQEADSIRAKSQSQPEYPMEHVCGVLAQQVTFPGQIRKMLINDRTTDDTHMITQPNTTWSKLYLVMLPMLLLL